MGVLESVPALTVGGNNGNTSWTWELFITECIWFLIVALVQIIYILNVIVSGYTPALACAPNKDVADCLALILATMMPVSPCTTAPTLSFSAINHYTTSPPKSVTFDSLPVLRGEHSSYCSFNNISHHDGIYKDEELNDSDSETYWGKEVGDKRQKHTRCLKITNRQLDQAEEEGRSPPPPPTGALRVHPHPAD